MCCTTFLWSGWTGDEVRRPQPRVRHGRTCIDWSPVYEGIDITLQRKSGIRVQRWSSRRRLSRCRFRAALWFMYCTNLAYRIGWEPRQRDTPRRCLSQPPATMTGPLLYSYIQHQQQNGVEVFFLLIVSIIYYSFIWMYVDTSQVTDLLWPSVPLRPPREWQAV